MEDLGLVFVRWGMVDLARLDTLVGRLHTAFARGTRLPRADRGWIARPSAGFAPQIHALHGA